MPFFMVVGMVVIVTFASMGTPFGWCVATLGLVGFVQSIVVWRRSRNS
jgi:hypothetical protein